jgi:hypothetical protein
MKCYTGKDMIESFRGFNNRLCGCSRGRQGDGRSLIICQNLQ